MLSHADLPDDLAVLKALLSASEHVVREYDSTKSERDDSGPEVREQLTTNGIEIELSKMMISKLRPMLFGCQSNKPTIR